jgi:hypothetical protein
LQRVGGHIEELPYGVEGSSQMSTLRRDGRPNGRRPVEYEMPVHDGEIIPKPGPESCQRRIRRTTMGALEVRKHDYGDGRV